MTPLSLLFRAWRYRLRLDVAEIAFVRQFLQKGMTAIDIGAHKGGYLYWLRKEVGETGRVVGFEPQPLLYDYLKSAVEKADYKNVTIENLAISTETGNLTLFVPQHGSKTSPGATLNAAKPNEVACAEITVQVVRLDDYCASQNLKPDLLKIDVEGFELDVFKGAATILKTCKPTLIFECEARHLHQTTMEEVFDYLASFGYKGAFFENKNLRPIAEFRLETHQKLAHGKPVRGEYANNFVFKP
ncbi:MAG: hypothetical protein RI894_2042 [Bacteroidota bacterium]|jgi:FkbM family methyltransferase